MYPFKAVLIGCSNDLLGSLERELSANEVDIVLDAPNARAVQAQVTPGGETRHLLIIQVQRPDQLAEIEHLSNVYAGWPILALMAGNMTPAEILAAQRRGAAQVVTLPLSGPDLREALRSIARLHGHKLTANELVVVAGAGEGCGATTVAMHVAYALAEDLGKETILVELALRLGRLANNLDLQPNITTPVLFEELPTLDARALKNALVHWGERLLILPGPYRQIAVPKATPDKVRELLLQLRGLTPLVVADVPATFDDVYFAALAAATRIVLVVEHSVPAIQSLTVVRDAIERHDITAPQVLVLNRFDRKREDMKAEKLEEIVHGPHFHLIPAHYESLRAAINKGKFVAEVDPHSPLVPAFKSLAEKLIAPPAELEAPQAQTASPLARLLKLFGL
jgi:pilus assembly protein CpaE